MKEKSNIFERIEVITEFNGIKGINGLAEALNYSSPEKIYRIGRDPKAKPSFEIISDLANKFEDLNLRWFITGKGAPFSEHAYDGDVDEKQQHEAADSAPHGEFYRLKLENEHLRDLNQTYLRIIEALSVTQKSLHEITKGIDTGTEH
ncbi:hypothetical protein [Pedobacter endophyticus]|uniref:Uncharacterized protein n=1 Tax=Pedobacter endophyticus TaxID=2789740 RepID=A0A7S9KYU6_9SPHI|nr:hypothetical protein [Pedobacter endophyticus]QPH39355.1 hypothetical protein IZT61_20315 [Pedobacter endophyticus]